jgi:hypothetical protein
MNLANIVIWSNHIILSDVSVPCGCEYVSYNDFHRYYRDNYLFFEKNTLFGGFEDFIAVTAKNVVFWDAVPCGPCKNRRFGGPYRHTFFRNVGFHKTHTAPHPRRRLSSRHYLFAKMEINLTGYNLEHSYSFSIDFEHCLYTSFGSYWIFI